MKTLYDLNPLAYQLQQIYEIQQRFKPPYILTPQPAIADFAREHQRWLKLLTKQFEIINKMANPKVFDFPNIINNAVYTYHNTDAEVFEINVEDQPVEISKTKVKEYFNALKKLKLNIPDNVILALSIALLLITILYFYSTFCPSLKDVCFAIFKWAYETGGLTFQKLFNKFIQLRDPNIASDVISGKLFDLILEFILQIYLGKILNLLQKDSQSEK